MSFLLVFDGSSSVTIFGMTIIIGEWTYPVVKSPGLFISGLVDGSYKLEEYLSPIIYIYREELVFFKINLTF